MVLGIVRARSRHAVPPSHPQRPAHAPAVRSWIAERGEVLFDAPCEVTGGFPGFADQGGRRELARFRVTERYLLVDDGDPRGFGLPVRWLDGVHLIPLPGHDDQGLRVFYHDGVSPRLFTVRFRGHRLAMRGARRAEHARAALAAAGLPAESPVNERLFPEFRVRWQDVGHLDQETIIWSGPVTAPRTIGADGVAADAWLTTRSLIWGSESGDGLTRVPLAWLTDAAATAAGDRQSVPAVFVGVGDALSGHHDLAFLFDRCPTLDHAIHDRGALLVGLRSRGIPLGVPTPAFHPWRVDAFPSLAASPATAPPLGAIATAAPGSEDEPAAGSAADIVLAEWLAPPESPFEIAQDVQLLAGPDVDYPGLDFGGVSDPAPPADRDRIDVEAEPAPQPVAPVEPVPARAARAYDYETTAVSALMELFAAIRDRAGGRAVRSLPPAWPSPKDQSDALSELRTLANDGVCPESEVRARADRIVALGEACVRLRSLLELRDSGHLSDDDLAARRHAITARLGLALDVR